jgi:hypothetical protein
VVAGLVVLALALGAVALIWLWRERGPAVESALPDLGEKPELGSAVDIGGALGGGLDEVWFQWVSDGTAQGRSAFLDADTIIACGRAEGGVVIGAVDVYESTANWKVNLAELTGDAAARPGAVWADGNGGVALALAMGDDSQAVATVTAKGEGSWRPGVQLLGAGAGLVAMREGGEVLVASTADLEQDQWRADAPAETASTAVLTSHDGIFWVWTGEGYREAKGGAAVGFGASGEAVSYRLEEGSVLLAVNPGEASSSVKRIDPKTGQGLWKDSLSVGGALTIRQPGDWLIVAGESEVKGIDPGSGAVKWSLPVERLIDASGDTAFLLSADNKISAVEASSGALDYQLAVRMEAADNASFAFGSKTAYVLDGSVLRAYRLAKDGETLWSLDLPDPGEATYYIHHADRKIWLQAGSSLRPLSGG